MLIVQRPQTNPYFNIAAEEYLLKMMDEDCFMLWQNEPSIIVGKHQNTLAEINHSLVMKEGIPVVRRISGGGTVVHDPGNLNFSFINIGDREKLVDFRKFTQPIIDFLNQLGVPARFEGKNDLRVNGLKISGNAEHVYKNKVLHHGTLLFSSDLSQLNHFIKVDAEKYSDKSVKSVRSKVANIVDFLIKPMDIVDFKANIMQYIFELYHDSKEYSLSQEDIKQIEELVENKYNTWQWNYGYSPKFVAKSNIKLKDKTVAFEITVEKGIIKKIDSSDSSFQIKFNDLLLNHTFEKEELRGKLNIGIEVHNLLDIQKEHFISQLFN